MTKHNGKARKAGERVGHALANRYKNKKVRRVAAAPAREAEAGGMLATLCPQRLAAPSKAGVKHARPCWRLLF